MKPPMPDISFTEAWSKASKVLETWGICEQCGRVGTTLVDKGINILLCDECVHLEKVNEMFGFVSRYN